MPSVYQDEIHLPLEAPYRSLIVSGTFNNDTGRWRLERLNHLAIIDIQGVEWIRAGSEWPTLAIRDWWVSQINMKWFAEIRRAIEERMADV